MGRIPKLTSELQDEIISHIQEGLNFREACVAAGIGKTTFYRWKAWGAKAKRGKFRDFWDALARARVFYKRARLKTIRRASEESPVETRVVKKRIPRKDSEGNVVYEEITEVVRVTKPPSWQAADRLLERVFAEEFSKHTLEHKGKVKQDHSGSVDSVVTVQGGFRWPDGSIRPEVPMETPAEVAAAGGRVPGVEGNNPDEENADAPTEPSAND